MVLINGLYTGVRRYVLPMFPSPCGDYGSYQGTGIAVAQQERQVSVPLRGLWFLSGNTQSTHSPIHDKNSMFPSPCGDYGSYRQDAQCFNGRLEGKVSVPLRGLWFLSF